jgi:hypothetical protein
MTVSTKYFAVVAAYTFLVTSAEALEATLSGDGVCQPKLSISEHIGYSYAGIYNNGAAPEMIECAFTMRYDANITVMNVEVNAYDRNSSADISCKVFGVGEAGFLIWTVPIVSAGSDRSPQWLLASINRQTIGTLHLQCVLPDRQGVGVSSISTIRITTSS